MQSLDLLDRGKAYDIVDGSGEMAIISSINRITGGSATQLAESVSELQRHIQRSDEWRRYVVLIDNAKDWTLAGQICAAVPRSIITAEQDDFIPADIDHDFVHIDPPTIDLAVDIAEWLRPDEPTQAIEDFVNAVGRKPRLIVDCLGMHNESEMSLEEMTVLINSEQSRIIQNRSNHERAVHVLYESYFERLDIRDPRAAQSLIAIAFLGRSTRRSELFRR